MIQRLAARQHGTVARWQLIAAGLTAHQIDERISAGSLAPLHRGVYLAGPVRPEYANEMAALLAFRLKATLSHRGALAIWELAPHRASAPVWVTIAPRMRPERSRVVVWRSDLSRRDVRIRHGMAVTSPPRTILDMSAIIDDPYELERLVTEASFRGLASEAELAAQLARNPGRRGAKRLRAVLDLPGGPRRTRSGGERAFLRLLREREIEGYEVNARVAGFEVDFLFRAERIVIEIDGWDGHSSRQAFERDRLKWAKLQAAGLGVMPVTARQIGDDPDGVVRRVLAGLRRT